jgi:membrane-bound lytic murein transglycosylase MltF
VYAESDEVRIENVEVESLEQFMKEFSVIPDELREYMGKVEEVEIDDFVLLDIHLSEELQNYTNEICKKYEMDYMFVLSVFATESEFKSGAKCKNQVGKGYSVGIGQLNQNYIKWFSELTGIENFDIYNDKHNIEGSVAVLKFYRDYWKNNVEGISEEDLWFFTLNSYNMGINGYKSYVRNTGEISRHYDRKVLKNKTKLEVDGGM